MESVWYDFFFFCYNYRPRGTELVLKTWSVLKYFEERTLSPDLKRTILPQDFVGAQAII